MVGTWDRWSYGLILTLGFLIKYPDTVDGEISMTGTTAPVRLVANSNGRMILLADNRQKMSKGDVIVYIVSGADYRHVLKVDSLLKDIYMNCYSEYSLPDSLMLGDISSAYSSFYLSYMQYSRIMGSKRRKITCFLIGFR